MGRENQREKPGHAAFRQSTVSVAFPGHPPAPPSLQARALIFNPFPQETEQADHSLQFCHSVVVATKEIYELINLIFFINGYHG